MHTNASNIGLSAVLVQHQEGIEPVIAYTNCTLSCTEIIYTTTKKESVAVVWTIMKFLPYLYGRTFKVVSYHHSLYWLVNLRDPSGLLACWRLGLQEFDVTIIYKSGCKHATSLLIAHLLNVSIMIWTKMADSLGPSPRLT